MLAVIKSFTVLNNFTLPLLAVYHNYYYCTSASICCSCSFIIGLKTDTISLVNLDQNVYDVLSVLLNIIIMRNIFIHSGSRLL